MLSIDLLGPPRVARDGRTVEMRVRKELALLAYLAVEARHRHSREALVGLLWPDAPEESARNNLRVALAELRRRLGEAGGPFLDADRQSVQFLAASAHRLDVAAFRDLLAAARAHAHPALERCEACLARLAEAVASYSGDFLAGFSLPDSAPFEEWVAVQREQLHQQQLSALDTLATAHELAGNYSALVEYGRRQLALEPWRESAHAQVIRGLWAQGQRGAALEQYESCRRILADELGLEPAPELAGMAEQLRAAQPATLARPSPPAAAPAQPAPLASAPTHNLPAQLTSFIGRDAHLAGLREALERARLITLTGPSGCGKTRLAIQAAGAALPAFADGVWLAELEALRDPNLLPQTVALALGLQLGANQPPLALLTAALQPKRLLLVLDTCEHLLAACASLAERLLRACPGLTIIATSRELLHIEGELVWPVPPLAAPEGAGQPPEQLLRYESLRLFVERARAASPGFTLNAHNALAVAQICQQLDHLPLAIELAAARVRHLPVETIAARLGDRFTLLAAAPGQQRLRAALDWSYALLSEAERACFRRLALFAGSFALQAAEQVAGDPAASAESTADLLAMLIDKSLVVTEQRPEGMRYRLLETMRAYAREQLQAAGEADLVGARQLAHFVQLAEQAEPQLLGDAQITWLDRLAGEHANLRAAADWATERGDLPAALRLVTALRYYWRVRGFYAEGIELLRGLLAHPLAAEPTLARARALNAAGYLEFVRGQPEPARALLEEALTVGRALAEPAAVAFALRYLCALANARQAHAEARACGEESLTIYRALGAANDIAGSAMYLGDVALAQGDNDRAEALYAESAAILRTRHNNIALAYPLRRLGFLALRRGLPSQAAALCADSLRLNLAVSDRQGVAACLVGLAAGAAAASQHERAAELIGQAEGLLDALRTQLLPYDRSIFDQVRTTVAEQLGAPAFAAACAAGRTTPIEQLLAAAEAAHAQHQAGPSQPPASTKSAELPKTEINTQHATLNTQPHNLPAPLTSFVGRAEELARVDSLLASGARLVTLVGPGGAGKTRLSSAIGWQLLPRFADGAWWVGLTGVQPSADAALERGTLVSAIAAALGHTLTGRRDPLDELAEALHDRAALLVLDNCEHLPEAAAVARALLEATPKLCVIATSREPLGLSSEALLRLDGLPVPEPGAADPASYPGVQLFLERAAQHSPSWRPTLASGAVARLCRLLDGMPLALELAAHWVGHFTPDEIAQEIQSDLDFLTARTRDLPDRHRSLRAVFDYAWRTLTPPQQQALMRFSVFRGSFDREAARAVAGVSVATIVALADKSLVRNVDSGHYSIHELLRQFAAEALRASGTEDELRARHAAYYLALAEQSGPELAGHQQAHWLARLDAALDNLRTALIWASDQADRTFALKLASALAPFWQRRCYLAEGRSWIERLLAGTSNETVEPAVRANALYGVGLLAHDQDDFASAEAFLSEGLLIDQVQGQTGRVAMVLAHRGIMARGQGQYAKAIVLLEESLALARAANDNAGIAYALFRLGVVTREHGDVVRATAIYQESLRTYRALGDRAGEAFTLLGMGDIARDQGNAVQLQAYSAEGLAIGRSLDHPWVVGFALNNLALAALMRADLARATALAEEALALFRAHGVRGGEVEMLVTAGQIDTAAGRTDQALARLLEGVRRGWSVGPHWLVATGAEELARHMGPAPDAVRIFAATDAWRASMGAPLPTYRQPAYDAALAAARHALGDERFAALWAEGAAWPLERAVAAILDPTAAQRVRAEARGSAAARRDAA